MRKQKKLATIIARITDYDLDLVGSEVERTSMDKSTVIRHAINNLREPSFLEALCLDAIDPNCRFSHGDSGIDYKAYLYKRLGRSLPDHTDKDNRVFPSDLTEIGEGRERITRNLLTTEKL